jgi:hypothetical protein
MQNKGYISRMTFSILTNNKESRDNWMLVVKQIHDIEMMTWGISKPDYYDALFSYKLTNPQTISRIWRKIQEHNPELRGEEWEQRQQQGGQIAQEIVFEKEKFQQIPLF